MRRNMKRAVWCVVLTFAIALTALTVMPGKWAQAKSGGITYNNKVFTKKLYKKTQVIGFGADGSLLISDKKYVKKVYKLLAKMELEEQTERDGEQMAGFVTLVLRRKDGTEKTFTFQGDVMSTGSKSYTIVKNNPLKKLHEIYSPGGKVPIFVECH